MQKSGCLLSLDSRNRINRDSSPSSCIFKLQDPVDASRFELTNFSFANTLYNVTSSNNTLYLNDTLAVTIEPGFWPAVDFVSQLEMQLESFIEGEGPYVVLNVALNTLQWTIGSNSITSQSTMSPLLGVFGSKTGTFTTTLFLVSTTALAVTSPQLQTQSYNSFPSTARVCIVVPVNSGYGDFQYWEPNRDAAMEFTRLQFDTLQMNILDAANGRSVNMGEWMANFVVM